MASAYSYKFLVVNDMHTEPKYKSESCIPPPDDLPNPTKILTQEAADPLAPIGRYGCDPPLSLFTTFLD